MALTKRRHPKTGEVAYQHFGSPRRDDVIANVFVCIDRIEVDESRVHSSPTLGAAAEWYEPLYEATFRPSDPTWPDAITWLRTHLGDALASEVERLLTTPAAFRE